MEWMCDFLVKFNESERPSCVEDAGVSNVLPDLGRGGGELEGEGEGESLDCVYVK